jgi:hypothetical protein
LIANPAANKRDATRIEKKILVQAGECRTHFELREEQPARMLRLRPKTSAGQEA